MNDSREGVNSRSSTLSFVMITPARNEEATIEKTARSVTTQTTLPSRWVVVSDGSTDRTDSIVLQYCGRYPWMVLIRLPEHENRNFAAKVHAFNAGLEALVGVSYDIVGSLDADVSFGEDYFEFLMARFKDDPSLGVAGTPFVEDGTTYDYRFTSIEHVSGACQLFRRECFEQIGGYVPIRGGGIDWTAVTTARMKGWRTRTFPERVCYHHRKMGTAGANTLGAWFQHGKKDYFLGGHPVWQVFRAAYQMKRRPFLIGGVLLLLGYVWAWITGSERPISRSLMAFHRHEQMARLKGFLFREGTN